jgi:hypothetical protein
VEDKMGWTGGTYGGEIPMCRILVGKSEGKRRPRRSSRWNTIKMYLNETDWENVDWIKLALIRVKWLNLVSTVMNIMFPHKCGKFLE